MDSEVSWRDVTIKERDAEIVRLGRLIDEHMARLEVSSLQMLVDDDLSFTVLLLLLCHTVYSAVALPTLQQSE